MNKQKIIMTRGIIASGKSTWGKQFISQNKHFIRVNKDEIRDELGIINWSRKREQEVVALQDERVHDALQKGWSVLIDNTHIHSKWITHFRKIAEEYNADFEIKNFEIDVEEAIRRDALRERPVGEKAIRRMARQAGRYKVADPIVYNPYLPFCIICDLDGTAALINERDAYDGKSCESDLPNLPVINLLQTYWRYTEDTIIIFSGRNDNSFYQTQKWLEKYNVPYDEIHMRKDGDGRSDDTVKEEMYLDYVHDKYNVRFILDDRKKVVDTWRSLGLTVFQVAPGDF